MDQTQPSNKQYDMMSVISYVGPLCLIPILTKNQDEAVKFHAKQGFVLFLAEVAVSIILTIFVFLAFLLPLFGIVWLIFSIIGILNAVKNEQKKLPVIGQFADKFKI